MQMSIGKNGSGSDDLGEKTGMLSIRGVNQRGSFPRSFHREKCRSDNVKKKKKKGEKRRKRGAAEKEG